MGKLCICYGFARICFELPWIKTPKVLNIKTYWSCANPADSPLRLNLFSFHCVKNILGSPPAKIQSETLLRKAVSISQCIRARHLVVSKWKCDTLCLARPETNCENCSSLGSFIWFGKRMSCWNAQLSSSSHCGSQECVAQCKFNKSQAWERKGIRGEYDEPCKAWTASVLFVSEHWTAPMNP